MSNCAERLIAALQDVLHYSEGPVALHEPTFVGNEWRYVCECIDSGWVSSVGSYVDRFERQLVEITGVQYVVATVNGTAALHATMETLGVGKGDEVLVPTLTFIATVNAVSYTGATPHFVDSDLQRLGIDISRLADYLDDIAVSDGTQDGKPRFRNRKTGRILRGVVPVHIFGHPVDMDPLMSLAARFGLDVVEDAAEGVGSTYKGRPLGSIGRIGTLSFNGNKIITTGGGGAALTNDRRLAERLRHLCTTAKTAGGWAHEHDMIGYNYRLPNINAALGCAQLEQLNGFISQKRQLAEAYREAVAGIPKMSFIAEPDDSCSNYWLNTIRLDVDVSIEERDQILKCLHDAGFLCRPAWKLMHTLPMFAHCPAMDCHVAEALSRRLINLPSSSKLIPHETPHLRRHRVPC